jgi:hypothetical protein
MPCGRAGAARPSCATGPVIGMRCTTRLYGELVFPLQVVIGQRPTTDYSGGEFVVVEQRPRAIRATASIPPVMGSWSPPATDPSALNEDGPAHRCATASASCLWTSPLWARLPRR